MNFESRRYRSPRSAVTLALACVGAIAPAILHAKQTPAQVIQSQVAEGLKLAATAQKKVEDHFAQRGVAPANRTAADLSVSPKNTKGKYVTALDIAGGVITLTYGGQANSEIVGGTLALVPLRSADGHISWQCGLAPAPSGLLPLPGAGVGATSIPNEYLPAPCGLSNALPIPAQVKEGFALGQGLTAEVLDYIAAYGSVPQDRTQARLSPSPSDTAGNYVSAVDISGGVVNITYGNLASAPIAGMNLALTPYQSADGSITWECGLAPVPPGLNPVTGAKVGYTSIANQYLPPECSQTGVASIPQQISEGLLLAAAAEVTVDDLIYATGTAPANRTAIGLTPNPWDTSGNYVSSMNVQNGGITITYGNRASAGIAGMTLGFTPWLSQSGMVIWQCGNSAAPAGAHSIGGFGVTSLPDKYLPPACQAVGSAPINKQITEGLRLARKLQAAVEKIYRVRGTLANASNGSLGLPPNANDTSGNYVYGITVASGAITIAYAQPGTNDLIEAQTLGLTPYVSADGKLTWVCDNANIPAGLISPLGGGVAATTIANQYLPINCRP